MTDTATSRRVRVPLDPARRRRHQAVALLVGGAFLADLVLGGVSPIFPLFAKHLGATSADLAALVTAGGLSSLAIVLPAARLADRFGKRYVFVSGIVLFGLTGLSFAAAGGVAVLALPQALAGVANVCTWTIGFACLADTVTGPALHKAVGFYTAAMGAGYGTGPLISGWSVGWLGYRETFLFLGLLGVCAGAVVLVGLTRAGVGSSQRRSLARHARAPRSGDSLAATLRRVRPAGNVVLASFSNLPTTLTINIGILTFFPVYAASLGWSTSLVGAVLFARAMASAIARLAMRRLHSVSVPPLVVIRATLVVETVILGLVATSRTPALTVALLAVEGANYGITMALAQVTIVAGTGPENSASSLVWYNAASCVAQLVGGALVAVLVGEHSARSAIFVVVGICLVLSCTYAVLLGWRSRRARAASAAAA